MVYRIHTMVLLDELLYNYVSSYIYRNCLLYYIYTQIYLPKQRKGDTSFGNEPTYLCKCVKWFA